jgi:hypothetical protein
MNRRTLTFELHVMYPIPDPAPLPWEGWALPAICEVLAEHFPSTNEPAFSVARTHVDGCICGELVADWRDWSDHVSELIAARIACNPARAAAALLSLEDPLQRKTTMRNFTLERSIDVTGVSGTGTVAEGVEFSDGLVALRWIVGKHRSTVILESIKSVQAIHGHNGATQVIWST